MRRFEVPGGLMPTLLSLLLLSAIPILFLGCSQREEFHSGTHASSWLKVAQFALAFPLPSLQSGPHQLEIAFDLPGIPEAEPKVEVRLTGAPQTLE